MNLSRVYAIVLRHYYLTIHQLERASDLFLFPILGLVLWGIFAVAFKDQFSSFVLFLVGGMILWDVWERNLINVMASPITLFEYISGLVAVSVVKVVVSFFAMWVVASLLFGFSISSFGFSLAAFWINLVIFAVVLGIFNVSIVMRFGNTVGPLTWILPFMIQPFAAVFYPISVLPPLVQKAVWFLPISHVFEGMRYTFEHKSFNSSEFLIAFVLSVVYFVLVLIFFAYMLNLVKRKGTL